jgi:hypothetical protein
MDSKWKDDRGPDWEGLPMFGQKPETALRKKFREFHAENPEVWELLKQFTFQIIGKGYKNYSINAVFERIRWHTAIETNDPDFKLSNNHRAYYARLFMEAHPEYDGFFRTKEVRE